MNKALVSVVLPCYNESIDIVDLALESIQNQTYTNIEIIVILDNPNNETIKKYLRGKKKTDSRIILLENNSNLGLVNSLNLGIRISKGYYIVRMDADDISNVERIDNQLQYMIKNGLDFVFTGMDHIDYKGAMISKDVLQEITERKLRFLLRFCNISNHPTWVFTRELYNNIGGYRHIPYCEDYDFILRATIYGYKIGRINANYLTYRHRDNSVSRLNNGRQVFNSYLVSREYRKGRLANNQFLALMNSKKIEEKYKQFCHFFNIYLIFNKTSEVYKKVFYMFILFLYPITRNLLISKLLRKLLTGDKNE